MKNLDLATFAVEELNETEIQNVDGGGAWAVFGLGVGAGVIAYCLYKGYI